MGNHDTFSATLPQGWAVSIFASGENGAFSACEEKAALRFTRRPSSHAASVMPDISKAHSYNDAMAGTKYELGFKRQSLRVLRRMPRHDAQRILRELERLAENRFALAREEVGEDAGEDGS